MKPRHSRIVYLLAVFVMFASQLAHATPTTRPTDGESKFLRFINEGDGGVLQASVVRYVNDAGVTVDLVAAVHIADRGFYRAIDQSFADYDAVLYEMVAPKEMLAPKVGGLRTMRKPDAPRERQPDDEQPAKRERGGSMSWVSAFQVFLRDRLELTFQLEEIDYHRPNFVHADLDYETFAKMQSDRGESFFSIMLNSMMRQMASGPAADQPNLGEIILAMQSPDKSRRLKLIFAKAMGQIDEQMASMEGPKGSVLLTERNKAALKVLRDAIAADKKSIAIFYGAAHLKGMDKILTREMGFRQVGPPFWRVAWDMTPPPSTQPTTAPSSN